MSKIKILKYILILLLVTNKAEAFLGGFINKVHSRFNKASHKVVNQVGRRVNHVVGHVKKLRNRVKKRSRMARLLAKKLNRKINKVPKIGAMIPKNINKAKNMLGKILNGSGRKGLKELKYIDQVRSCYDFLKKIVTHKNPKQMVVRLARQGEMGESVKENLVQGVDILGSIQSSINEYAFSRESDQQAKMIRKIVINPLNEKAEDIEDPKAKANTKIMAKNLEDAVTKTLLQIKTEE